MIISEKLLCGIVSALSKFLTLTGIGEIRFASGFGDEIGLKMVLLGVDSPFDLIWLVDRSTQVSWVDSLFSNGA